MTFVFRNKPENLWSYRIARSICFSFNVSQTNIKLNFPYWISQDRKSALRLAFDLVVACDGNGSQVHWNVGLTSFSSLIRVYTICLSRTASCLPRVRARSKSSRLLWLCASFTLFVTWNEWKSRGVCYCSLLCIDESILTRNSWLELRIVSYK